jgi:hypothetical protein
MRQWPANSYNCMSLSFIVLQNDVEGSLSTSFCYFKSVRCHFSTLEIHFLFFRMNFVKVLIPLKGVLKRVPSAVGGDHNLWVAGSSPL